MSCFVGILPKTCSDCFYWDGRKWVQIDSGLCDECDYMLEMFPVLDADRRIGREKMNLLETWDKPEWSPAQKTR